VNGRMTLATGWCITATEEYSTVPQPCTRRHTTVAWRFTLGRRDSTQTVSDNQGRFMRFLITLLVSLSGWFAPPGLGAQEAFVVPVDEVTSRVIVRSGPSAETADVGSLRPGSRADLLGSVPRWYRVRLVDGTEGFVSKRWTRVVPSEEALSFQVHVIDVGTGLGVLVLGGDFAMLYDGGSNDDRRLDENNRLLAYLRSVAIELEEIDHIILSHPHRDHVELLPDVFAHYQVRRVWDSGRFWDICGYRAFITAVRDEPSVGYHSATQDFGVREFAFGAANCYGRALQPDTIAIPHGHRINEHPVPLGRGAAMTFLYADGNPHTSPNENSLVVRLDLGESRVLFMGDAEAGGRRHPNIPPHPSSVEGVLLDCCQSDLRADVLIVGHHGSMTSSRAVFLDAVGASTFVISSGPTRYGAVVLPDPEVVAELASRGSVFRTDLNDATCGTDPAKVGTPADGRPGGCDNVQILISEENQITVEYWPRNEP
jgi:beta-lactamase superfamily II metal-dependent hydrolase